MKRLLFLIPTILTVTLLSLTLSTTQSSAKSYPEVISNRLSGGAATSRNFWANGSNAIYSKAGILPGARLVTSKSMLNSYKVGASTDKLLVHAAYTLRGYQTAKLSNGSYYMKVVSFNGKIRGWIYVGKTNPALNGFQNVGGGLQYVTTTRTAPLPTQLYKLRAGSANALWNYPYLSQYKARKLDGSLSTYQNDIFKVTKSIYLTAPEGRMYYYVTSQEHPTIQDWIFVHGLQAIK